MTIPATMPASRIITLKRIIRDPIIRLPRFFVVAGGESRRVEPKLTHRPRLCDLMSLIGLAYLILGFETVKKVQGPVRIGR
jgi:hypothetical protein